MYVHERRAERGRRKCAAEAQGDAEHMPENTFFALLAERHFWS